MDRAKFLFTLQMNRSVAVGRKCVIINMSNELLYITNFVSITLFIISEVLGMSSCEFNGVFQLAFNGCCLCKRKIYVDVNVPAEDHVI